MISVVLLVAWLTVTKFTMRQVGYVYAERLFKSLAELSTQRKLQYLVTLVPAPDSGGTVQPCDSTPDKAADSSGGDLTLLHGLLSRLLDESLKSADIEEAPPAAA